ncbi:VIT family-domain-containing protein [Dipodascopsis uninucleata]
MATLIRCLMGYKPTSKVNNVNRLSSESSIANTERSYNFISTFNEVDSTGSSKKPQTSLLPMYETDENQPLLEHDGQSAASTDDTVTSSSSQRATWLSPRVISDAVIGLSDGLTVPFALTAGLSSLGDTKVVITGGIAELVSGAISMGLGGYLGAKSESDCYKSALEREKELFQVSRGSSEEAVIESLSEYGFAPSTLSAILGDLEKSPEEMINFVMKFGRGLDEPAIGREFISALTIGSAYFLGGFVPLFPYFFVTTVQTGLILSSVIMIITLFIFGVVKTIFTGNNSYRQTIWGGVQMVLTGAIAAGAAWGMVRLIDSR